MNTKLVMNQSNLQVRPTLPKNKHKDKFSQILTTSNFVAKNFLIVLCWQKHLLIVFNCYISNNVIEIYIHPNTPKRRKSIISVAAGTHILHDNYYYLVQIILFFTV